MPLKDTIKQHQGLVIPCQIINKAADITTLDINEILLAYTVGVQLILKSKLH